MYRLLHFTAVNVTKQPRTQSAKNKRTKETNTVTYIWTTTSTKSLKLQFHSDFLSHRMTTCNNNYFVDKNKLQTTNHSAAFHLSVKTETFPLLLKSRPKTGQLEKQTKNHPISMPNDKLYQTIK